MTKSTGGNSGNGKLVRKVNPVPAEGEGGLFSQTWYPICKSGEVAPGAILGKGFLDGRVIVFRNGAGVAQVLSAYCPHVGADLSVGDVVDDTVRCAFHFWQYDHGGKCVKTGIGDPPPPTACLFKFPTAEKFGVVWAFNGEEATWELPDLPLPEEELAIRVEVDRPIYRVDPWVIAANTPDWQHIKVVHQVDFDFADMYDRIEWTDNTMKYSFSGRLEQGEGPEIAYNVAIYGTSIFLLHGVRDGLWYAAMTPFGIPKLGHTEVFFILCVKKGDGSPESNAEIEMLLGMLYRMGLNMTGEDKPILKTINYRPGLMIRSDQALVKYLDLVRNYPRAHPSADFIR